MTTVAKMDSARQFDWGSLPQGEHFVQVYEDESNLTEVLAGFVAHALESGGLAIVIATAAHRSSLRARLLAAGHDPAAAIVRGDYLALDAANTLSRFMVDGMPDAARFNATLHPVIAAARAAGRRVHAFGEMVALLWSQGNPEATLALERLWEAFCKANGVTLFCAYPRFASTRDLGASLAEACALHDRVIPPA